MRSQSMRRLMRVVLAINGALLLVLWAFTERFDGPYAQSISSIVKLAQV
jgi:hypothetical protein